MKISLKQLLLGSITSVFLLTSSNAIAEDKVLAEFNGAKITESEINKAISDKFSSHPSVGKKKFSELEKGLQQDLLRSYVREKLLNKELESSKIQDSQEFKDQLEALKSQLAQQLFVNKILKQKVTDQMIKDEYKKAEQALKGKKEVKISHILVEDEKVANELHQKLEKGEKFSELAKNYSKDEGSKSNGGSLGFIREGVTVKDFEKVAFSTSKGKFSKPFKTDFGWHVIMVEDMRDIKLPSIKEAENSIRQNLSASALESYFDELSKKHNFKSNLEN